jgi:hypothetical protein
MLEKLSSHRSDTWISVATPEVDSGANVVDEGVDLSPFPPDVEVELRLICFSCRSSFSAPADRHGNKRLAGASADLNIAGGSIVTDHEIFAGRVVGRIEDRVIEAIGQSHRCNLTLGSLKLTETRGYF